MAKRKINKQVKLVLKKLFEVTSKSLIKELLHLLANDISQFLLKIIKTAIKEWFYNIGDLL